MDTKKKRIMAHKERYLQEMRKYIPVTDDKLLFDHHKAAVQRVMTNIDKAAVGEAFMDIIDLNWKKCEENYCETLNRVEKRILSDKTKDNRGNYWSRMKRLAEGCKSEGHMQFVRLQYLDKRQTADFVMMMEEVQKQALETGDSEKNFDKALKLRMTWGRAIVFWNYWIGCRKETIDILNSVLDIFKGVELPADERSQVQDLLEMIESHHGLDNFPLQFAHVVNKDLACYKVLLRKLTEFLDLVTSTEYRKAFGVAPKNLFFNISSFQTSISTRQTDTCRGFEICKNIISREQDGLGETAELVACTSRPLLHFKDLLRKLYDEGRLNQTGLEDVINDLQQEETDMSTIFSESLLTFLEVSCKVKDAVELLRMDIGEWLPKREKSITTMKEIIEKLNKTTRDVAITKTVSSSVGIVGGAIAIGGLSFAPFTLGASLIPAAIAGGVVSGLGAATTIGAAVAEIFIDKGEMEKAMTCIEEDKVLLEGVAKRIENLNRNSTMLLRYIPQDELESLISVMTDPQSTAMVCISAKFQVDPRIAIDVVRVVSFFGKAVVMPVTRMAFTGAIAASKAVLIPLAHIIAGIGVALDIANLVLASVKLGKGAKSENAEKLEEVLKQMEEEKGVIENCLAEMSKS